MGNTASSGKGKDGPSMGGRKGGASGSSPMLDEDSTIASTSRKEDVEAGVQHRKGLVFLQNQRYDDALKAFDESLKFRRMLNQENTFEFAATSLQYAIALSLSTGGRMIMARFEEAFKLLRDLQATETLVYATGLAALGQWLVRDGRHKEGIDKLREALAVLARLPATEKGVKSETQTVRCELANALVAAGEAEESEQLCSRLLEETGGDNVRRGQVLVVLARVKLKTGKTAEARELLRQTIDLLNKHVPDEPLWLTRQRGAVPLAAAEALLKEIP